MLTFNLKKEWYEKIRSGEKTIEYREVKPYWTNRIKKEFSYIPDLFDDAQIGDWLHCSLTNETCTLRLGYTKRHMTAKIEMITIINGKNTDLAIDAPVYAIHLADVREVEKGGNK